MFMVCFDSKGNMGSNVEVIGCHEDFKTVFEWDVHVGYVACISVFVVVVEVFGNLFEDNAAI